MNDKPIDEQALDALERRLWEIIAQRSLTDENPPPRLETLLKSDICEAFGDDLNAYAYDLAHGNEARWRDHPLLHHLTQCDVCQQQLTEFSRLYRQSPAIHRSSKEDIDITLFYEHLPHDDQQGVRGEGLRTGPKLLGAGLLENPAGWYFSLEQLSPEEDKPGGLLFTLISPQGEMANVEVRMVLLGRILHGLTNAKGQIFFPHISIPQLDTPLTPALNVHLTLPA